MVEKYVWKPLQLTIGSSVLFSIKFYNYGKLEWRKLGKSAFQRVNVQSFYFVLGYCYKNAELRVASYSEC